MQTNASAYYRPIVNALSNGLAQCWDAVWQVAILGTVEWNVELHLFHCLHQMVTHYVFRSFLSLAAILSVLLSFTVWRTCCMARELVFNAQQRSGELLYVPREMHRKRSCFCIFFPKRIFRSFCHKCVSCLMPNGRGGNGFVFPRNAAPLINSAYVDIMDNLSCDG